MKFSFLQKKNIGTTTYKLKNQSADPDIPLHQLYHESNYSPIKNKDIFRVDRVECCTKLIFETFLLMVYINLF